MLFKRTSRLSGIERSRDLPVTEEQLARWKAGTPIQFAMPHLSANDREFILSGITLEEWEDAITGDLDAE